MKRPLFIPLEAVQDFLNPPSRRKAPATPDTKFAREFDELVRRENGWTPRHVGEPNHDRDALDAAVYAQMSQLGRTLGRPLFED